MHSCTSDKAGLGALLVCSPPSLASFMQAYSLMEEMRQRIPNVNMVYYVDVRTLEAVHSALGIPLGRGIGAEVQRGRVGGEGGGEEESDGEESVGEEVEEGY